MKMVIKFMYILSTFHLFVFFNDYNGNNSTMFFWRGSWIHSRLSRFPPLEIPCYTAKLSYCHPPQVFRHKSRKTNLNSPVSTTHNYFLTAVYWSLSFSSNTTFLLQLIKLQILLRIKSTNVITRKVNTGSYSNQNNWSINITTNCR
jgi:hypothetical protein